MRAHHHGASFAAALAFPRLTRLLALAAGLTGAAVPLLAHAGDAAPLRKLIERVAELIARHPQSAIESLPLALSPTLSAPLALALSLPGRFSRFLASLLNVALAGTGVFVAGYQVWLQRFATDVSCTANAPWWEEFVYWAGEKVPALFEATGLCSEAGWKFLGLAIADWSLLAFSGLLILTLVALAQTLRGR